ncbi:hypothetical protein [Bacillus sp. FJAT-26390]|uniref:hypothetical protein n=1 Tax=Bacillus sp. FJAT-26390 TaxID=1743142 RepID=UPI00159EEC71|nr:hypothetical protein [Bacillus sp. FJAT-26390]
MNWRKATRAQLVIIAFNDEKASTVDKAAAQGELLRREKRISSKPTMRGKELFKR